MLLARVTRAPSRKDEDEEAAISSPRSLSCPPDFPGGHQKFPTTDTTSTDETLIAAPSDPCVVTAKSEIASNKRKPRKKALLIGIKYTNGDGKELNGPHKDVQDMKQVLIGKFKFYLVIASVNIHTTTELYGYEEANITMLIDNGEPNILPTRRNMVRNLF
jgi:hypothetical protein